MGCGWLSYFENFSSSGLSQTKQIAVVGLASIWHPFASFAGFLVCCCVTLGHPPCNCLGGQGRKVRKVTALCRAVLVHVRDCAVGSNVRAANAQVAVRSVGERCAKQSMFIRTSSAKVEASQNRGKSDFQKSYTEALTAKEMGAIVESARVPRIVLA